MQDIRKIKLKRIQKGWTQMELAEKSGVPQPTISQIEQGNRKYPTHESIRKIAMALEVDMQELDDDEEVTIKEG
ncbi:helix-turn-helix domain-containing protein [Paenibacillus tuaregi]|uniref:helix-turn-helix domain-containing protein n=1 Tax=Paenibacillus tuaregi TaxID=1816681 RepID=UPI000A9FDCED|nr:helix-turn-helix transcriptional regulator [Paenibacillus tuaregi]